MHKKRRSQTTCKKCVFKPRRDMAIGQGWHNISCVVFMVFPCFLRSHMSIFQVLSVISPQKVPFSRFKIHKNFSEMSHCEAENHVVHQLPGSHLWDPGSWWTTRQCIVSHSWFYSVYWPAWYSSTQLCVYTICPWYTVLLQLAPTVSCILSISRVPWSYPISRGGQ